MLGHQQPDPQPLKGDPEAGLELDSVKAFPHCLDCCYGDHTGGGAGSGREPSFCISDPARALNQAVLPRGAPLVNTDMVPVPLTAPPPRPACELTGQAGI